MRDPSQTFRRALLSATIIALAGVAAAGCSPGDIQFEGKIFDAVGLNSSQKAKEPKLAERAPLVIPPAVNSLPNPNQVAAEQPEIAGVTDHDAGNRADRAALEKQQAEYCKVNYEIPKAQGRDDADTATGPLGPCRASILTELPKVISGSESE